MSAQTLQHPVPIAPVIPIPVNRAPAVPNPAKVKKMMQFRLHTGRHEGLGPPPEYAPNWQYSQGDTVEHHLDLAARWPEKFTRLHEDNNPNLNVWDSSKETLEQFTKRMSALTPPAPALASVASTQPTPSQSQQDSIAEAAASWEKMSLQDLRKWAENNEIDVSRQKTKEEVINVLKKSM